MKRIGNIFTLVVLATLLLLNSTPREFIHSFAGHQDTVDHLHPQDATDHHADFETQHHHCAFLQLIIPVYNSTEENFQLLFLPEKRVFFLAPTAFVFLEKKGFVLLRGPPIG